METKQFILLAPPGAKGADHAADLAKRWQVPHVSMAELVETAIAQETEVGLAAQTCLAAEASLADSVALKLLRQRLEQPDTVLKGWVLSDFPRTLSQAQGLHEWWSKLGRSRPTVIYLKAMTGILMNRLVTEPEQTATAPVLRRRLEQYQAEVTPLLEYYQQLDQLTTLNANLPFAEVSQELAGVGRTASSAAAPLIEDEAELDTLIYGQSRLVVDCMAAWCGSCKQISPFIDKLAEEYRDRVNVRKIDFDANRQLSKRFGLQGIPAVLYFKNGKLLKTLTGVKSYTEYTEAVSNLLE